ncbi:MAG: Nif3-like dinuclear metal center hexameric protein [Ekhidna sp.]|nr:Nif3-like dinuclear metal center hexameric protein [Ekhidna sp.]
MKIKEITDFLESWAPPSLQEPYDNAGLIMGDKSDEVNAALITLDVTEGVVDEAINENCNLIIAHHPLIFKGIKRINKSHWIDKCIRKAVRNDIAVYAIHTNLDNIQTGVNLKICERIGLSNLKVLNPKSSTLSKLTVFVPFENRHELLDGLFQAGAGQIGNYDHCSFQMNGIGSFRGNQDANPAIGSPGIDENVNETRIEVLVHKHLEEDVLRAMSAHHPYEEVAYYLSELRNKNQETGSGMIGYLAQETRINDFFPNLKKSMNLHIIKHTKLIKERINKVAVCGGSGSFLLSPAIKAGADLFISSDFRYHDYFEANDDIVIADIGHYESEIYTKDLLHDALTKTFTKFAFRLSKVDTNPIKYL